LTEREKEGEEGERVKGKKDSVKKKRTSRKVSKIRMKNQPESKK
jgi:hypothetical protein